MARPDESVTQPTGGMALEAHHSLPALPLPLREYVVVDDTGPATIVYIDRNHKTNRLFVTWLSDCKRARPIAPTVEVVNAADIAAHRARIRAESETSAATAEFEDATVAYVYDMVVRACEYGTSDIHIQTRAKDTSIQFDIDGESRIADYLTVAEGAKVLRAIYQGYAPQTDASYMPGSFQNAQIPGEKFPASTGLTSIRGIRGPCYDGEFMTLRLQYKGGYVSARRTESLPYPKAPGGEYRLPKMGFMKEQLERLDEMMAAPSGIIIVTGPTGSGKTTTLYELLTEAQRRKPYKRLITVEDPVEIPNPNGVQLFITNASDAESTAKAYRERVRAMLRMAPKIIFIGELRDEEVAATALEAANTGHLVLTTLHTEDAFEWVDRLEDMGSRLKRKAFCNANRIRGVVAQRIMSYVCPHCSIQVAKHTREIEEHPNSTRIKQVMQKMATWGNVELVRIRGKGCAECRNSGVIRRQAIADVVLHDAEIMTDYIEHGVEIARRNYRARPTSDKSMLERAIAMSLQGKIDPISIEDTINVIPRKSHEPSVRHHRESAGADDMHGTQVVGLR